MLVPVAAFYVAFVIPPRLFEAYYRHGWHVDIMLLVAVAGFFLVSVLISLLGGSSFHGARLVTRVLVIGATIALDAGLSLAGSPAVLVPVVLEGFLPVLLLALARVAPAGDHDATTGGEKSVQSITPANGMPGRGDLLARVMLAGALLLAPAGILGLFHVRQGTVASFDGARDYTFSIWLILAGAVMGTLLVHALKHVESTRLFHVPRLLLVIWGACHAGSTALQGVAPQTMAGFVMSEILLGTGFSTAIAIISTLLRGIGKHLGRTSAGTGMLQQTAVLALNGVLVACILLSVYMNVNQFSYLFNLTGLLQFWLTPLACIATGFVLAGFVLEWGLLPGRLVGLASKHRRARVRAAYWASCLALVCGGSLLVAAAAPALTSPVARHQVVAISPSVIMLPPALAHWQAMYDDTFDALASNINHATLVDGLFAHPGGWYQTGWLWDTALIAWVWQLVSPGIARDLVCTFLEGAANPNGMISHMYGPTGKSGYSQPPLFPWAIWNLYCQTGNIELLQETFPILEHDFQYWITTRDPDGSGLYSWWHRDESGLDDTPALPSNPSNTDAFDLSAWLVLAAEHLEKIAAELGNDAAASTYASWRARLVSAIQASCWDNDTAFFYNVDRSTGGFIRVKTNTVALALLAGIATPGQAGLLCARHLLNASEFWTAYPLPTTAIDEPAYDLHYWRGPVWINMNFFAALGFIRYGYLAEARELLRKTIEMAATVHHERGYLYEYYNPETGNVTDVYNPGGGMPQENFVGWSGLVNVMLKQYLLGVGKNLTGVADGGFSISFLPLLVDAFMNETIHYEDGELEIDMCLKFGDAIDVSIKVHPGTYNATSATLVDTDIEVPQEMSWNATGSCFEGTVENFHRYALSFS